MTEVRTGLPDYRGSKFSAYTFKLFDGSGNELFGENIGISQFVKYETSIGEEIAAVEVIEGEFYVPYFKNGAKIAIW